MVEAKEPKSPTADAQAGLMTADFSQHLDFVDNEESKKETGAPAKRTAKAKAKSDAKKAKAAQLSEGKPFDEEVITSAVEQFKHKDPSKPSKGRKPIREDIYISQSLEKISQMEQRLIDEKDTLTDKEKQMLRNKASALKTRVNAKLGKKSLVSDIDFAKTQSATLFGILAQELDEEAFQRVSKKLSRHIAAAEKDKLKEKS